MIFFSSAPERTVNAPLIKKLGINADASDNARLISDDVEYDSNVQNVPKEEEVS